MLVLMNAYSHLFRVILNEKGLLLKLVGGGVNERLLVYEKRRAFHSPPRCYVSYFLKPLAFIN